MLVSYIFRAFPDAILCSQRTYTSSSKKQVSTWKKICLITILGHSGGFEGAYMIQLS